MFMFLTFKVLSNIQYILLKKVNFCLKFVTCTRKHEETCNTTQNKIAHLEFSIYLQIFPEDSSGLDFTFVVVGTQSAWFVYAVAVESVAYFADLVVAV